MNLNDITMKQPPYLRGDNDNKWYEARGIGLDGKTYCIKWEIIADDFESLTDESEACDWYNPVSIGAIK